MLTYNVKHNLQCKHLSIMPSEEGNLVGVHTIRHTMGYKPIVCELKKKEEADIEQNQLA